MMFRMGGAEAFAWQHVSMADNRQNDTRPIQPSQPPMASQIHPESHRPIADSPDQLAHSPKPPATPPSQWQERSTAQYDFRPVGQFPFAHAHKQTGSLVSAMAWRRSPVRSMRRSDRTIPSNRPCQANSQDHRWPGTRSR